MTLVRRAFILFPLITMSLGVGSTCSMFSDASSADSIRRELQVSFDFIDSTLLQAEQFNTDFLANAPTFELMGSNLRTLIPLDDQLVDAQAALTHTRDVQQDMLYLNMPDWYTGPYAAAVDDQIEQREQAVAQYQAILLKEKNFALAVTSFYSGLYRFYAATDAVDTLPPLDPENPQPVATEVQLIQEEISLATSDFNSAAAYVNVELFTRMRDSAVDFQQALDTLSQMASWLEAMQQEADPDQLQIMFDQVDQLSYTLDLLLTQFSAGIPTEYLNEQDQFTSVALEDFVAWRVTTIDSIVSEARATVYAIDYIDSQADNIYTTYR